MHPNEPKAPRWLALDVRRQLFRLLCPLGLVPGLGALRPVPLKGHWLLPEGGHDTCPVNGISPMVAMGPPRDWWPPAQMVSCLVKGVTPLPLGAW